MYTRSAVFRLNASSDPVFGRGRAFRRNTVTSQWKPDACKTLAAAGRFKRSGKTTSMRPPPSAASGGRCEQAQLASPVDRLCAAVHAELGVDVAHVCLDRADREVELAADLGGGKVGGEVAEHAQLALAQVLAQLWALAGWRGQGGAGEHVEDVREQRGVGGAVSRVALEQRVHGRRHEREDDSVALGALERALDARLGRVQVTERFASERVDQERLDR